MALSGFKPVTFRTQGHRDLLSLKYAYFLPDDSSSIISGYIPIERDHSVVYKMLDSRLIYQQPKGDHIMAVFK
uniref:Uncharacterized protein n=1 Tax=Arion vulgaris TaxID=1028688 RepID=A0A0B7B3T6_9EUPU